MADFLDLCSGIGAFRMAAEQLNHCSLGYAEIDKFPRKSYEAIYDTKDEWSAWDLKEVPNEEWEKFKGGVDFITAGFPCQSFSVAGKGLGFQDTRGTVFFEIARAIKYTSPTYFILENVKNLISHDKGKTIDTIIKTLNDLGYTIDYTILNSKYFGVPQNRERTFIVGVKNGKTEAWRIEGTNALAKSKRRIASYSWSKTFNFDWPDNSTVMNQLIDVLEKEEDIPKNLYLSPEKTKTLIESILKRDEKLGRTDALRMLGLLDIKGQDNVRRVYDPLGISPTLTTMGGGNREPKILVAGNVNPSGRGMNGQVYQAEEGVSPTLSTNKGEGVKIAYCPIINPSKVEVRQDGRRLKNDGEEMFTLTASDRHGLVIYEKKPQVSDYVVRKLTPKECWRLQAFPDWAYNKAAEVNSATQLYKQAGNAVTVTVAYEVIKRLIPY